jgi:CHASE1-domain containing sensor protein
VKVILLFLGVLALVAGLLFAGQGAGIVTWPQSSFMVNATEWILYGLVLAGIGLVLIGLATRRRA